ncbi:hypothetical protein H5117_18605 [Pseudoalteromonas sp. SG45-1]|jgi:hypothetical protein|uniref:hypothetical protein n=1 Tax=Pseudoalteromonas distincta TaxID=77608 RepID=UPI000412BE39|nr:hypothetical protein [Pseudoalteromonas sp. SR43-3]MBB1356447.1 hypothetical protein [Pseudoalteromonas sp. SR45-5]MBB1403682.1 hypothetical protein [Pseudoalteromonas sp. SG45-1]|tara:strand:+ start:823 stop:978 length:156 start_codon:yes stop_codon:yes gene_type:complete
MKYFSFAEKLLALLRIWSGLYELSQVMDGSYARVEADFGASSTHFLFDNKY